MCNMCRDGLEDSAHVLVHCKFAHKVRSLCLKWWGTSMVLPRSYLDAFEQHFSVIHDRKVEKTWDVMWAAVVWSLSLTRTDRLFKGKQIEEGKAVEVVQAGALHWIKARSKVCNVKLSYWILEPIECLRSIIQ
ncbi:hypothetical protein SLA2020_042170 [Shorea laevis]